MSLIEIVKNKSRINRQMMLQVLLIQHFDYLNNKFNVK